MPVPDPKKIKKFKSAADLGKWLKANHDSENELWVKVLKVRTEKPSVTWREIVIESLCWGWIDGIKKSVDESAYLQRITPRKPKSAWSKKNREHAERLIETGRIQPPGLEQVRSAQSDGRWDSAYAPSSEMEVPADFVQAVESQPEAKQFFGTLNKSSRYAIAYGLTTAKKPETRQRRFQKFLDMLVRREEPGFGFKKNKKKKR